MASVVAQPSGVARQERPGVTPGGQAYASSGTRAIVSSSAPPGRVDARRTSSGSAAAGPTSTQRKASGSGGSGPSSSENTEGKRRATEACERARSTRAPRPSSSSTSSTETSSGAPSTASVAVPGLSPWSDAGAGA